jgi:hypothetical protein
MSRIRLEDIQDTTLRDRIARQLAKEIPAVAFGERPHERHSPNATEIEARRVLGLEGIGLDYESRTFRVVGHDYTPDWCGSGVAIEVKGAFIHSRDGRILFDAARLAHPELKWIWAQKKKGGKKGDRWQVDIWPRKI